jgi:hypothetical protein
MERELLQEAGAGKYVSTSGISRMYLISTEGML